MPSGRLITTLSLSPTVYTHTAERETNEGGLSAVRFCGLKHFFLFCTLSLLIVVYLPPSFLILAFIYYATTPTYTSFSCFPAIRFASHAKYIYTRAGGGGVAAAARLRAASLLSLSIWMTTSRRGDRCVWLGCLPAWAGYSRSRLLPS